MVSVFDKFLKLYSRRRITHLSQAIGNFLGSRLSQSKALVEEMLQGMWIMWLVTQGRRGQEP
jgi:hypothetical protein